jgi:hypothetical protein
MRALHFLSVDTRTVARLVVIVCLVSLTAASPGRLSAQTAAPALAPRLGGLSDLHMPVSTQNAGAQAFFDQGLRLLYAFNHAEARRAFREAARLDARLAMAHWGEAMTLAVNLNGRSPDRRRHWSVRSSMRWCSASPPIRPPPGLRSIAPTPRR